MDQTRAGLIAKDVVEALRDVIRRHGVTYPEYRRAIEFLATAGRAGELPLLSDVLLESTVVEAAGQAPGATDANVEARSSPPGPPISGPAGATARPSPSPCGRTSRATPSSSPAPSARPTGPRSPA